MKLKNTIPYGTEETIHNGVCKECVKEKSVRLYLNTSGEECKVCDDCYLKDC